jgi:lysyl-tRNA synthetase class 2
VKYQNTEVDFAPPWERLTVVDALAKYAGLQVSDMSVDELSAELEKRENKKHSDLTWGLAVARLFELCCEEHLIQPVFIMDHPVEISPLTKIKRGDKRLVERFEPFVCGMEIGNAYSELTDPVIQLERLTKQREIKEEDQGYENHSVDADFVRAIGCGMPPTGGVGIGIDRLVMLLTDASTIRDIIPFPMIKPKE